jgi:glycosyltransferase involved in cell wall biosynthesis
MKTLVNALLLNDTFSGMQYSTEFLLRALDDLLAPCSCPHRVEVLVPGNYRGRTDTGRNMAVRTIPAATGSRLKRIYYENVGIPRHFRKNGFDVYHATANLLPFFSTLPSVLTVHDLVPVNYPQYVPPETSAYYRLFFARSVYKAHRIIAVSNKVKEDLMSRFRIDEDKIRVVYHGVENGFKRVTSPERLKDIAAKYNLPGKFILFVGNLEPRKNLPRVIDAFIDLRKRYGIEHKLVIAGKKAWKSNAIFDRQKSDTMKDQVIFTGYVEREDLPGIYSLSDLFVFPSLYEGFGLPVVEAMACEVPVLVSEEGALPEITANIYPRANAFDAKDIADKIYMLLKDPEVRKQNISHGTERAKYFTWQKAAAETLNVYEQVAGS